MLVSQEGPGSMEIVKFVYAFGYHNDETTLEVIWS
jgi:hypothetical protein